LRKQVERVVGQTARRQARETARGYTEILGGHTEMHGVVLQFSVQLCVENNQSDHGHGGRNYS
jgi:hypothetical protein